MLIIGEKNARYLCLVNSDICKWGAAIQLKPQWPILYAKTSIKMSNFFRGGSKKIKYSGRLLVQAKTTD
jgi:hypothetical protein